VRARITWTGILVLVVGLIVAGGAYAYASIDGEWVGGVLFAIGLITGLAGATMSKPVSK
jgi:hypothetical protein